jgi:hypothetical protein
LINQLSAGVVSVRRLDLFSDSKTEHSKHRAGIPFMYSSSEWRKRKEDETSYLQRQGRNVPNVDIFHRRGPGEDDVCCWMHHSKTEPIGGWFAGGAGGEEESRDQTSGEDIQERGGITQGVEGTAKNAVKM